MQIACVSDLNFDHAELCDAFRFLSCQIGAIDLNHLRAVRVNRATCGRGPQFPEFFQRAWRIRFVTPGSSQHRGESSCQYRVFCDRRVPSLRSTTTTPPPSATLLP